MYLGQWQWRVSFPDKGEGEREREDYLGCTERLKKKRTEITGWRGWQRKTQPNIWKQTIWLVGVEAPGYSVYSAVSMCIHVLPLQKKENKVLLLPSFLFTHALSRSSHPFPVFNYTDYLNSVSLVYLPNQMHFCLSVGYSHINVPLIFWGRHCFPSPTSLIGRLEKQNTYPPSLSWD